MKFLTRERLPFVLTGLLIALATAAVIVFLATASSTPTAAPTPTRAAGSGTEVLPPTATPTIAHLGTDQEPLVTTPLPKSASASGKLVQGFPSAIIPLPSAATVANSAVSTQGTRMQVTLVGMSKTDPADVQAFFQSSFTPQGLAGAAGQSAPGTTTTVYYRGTDSITVTTMTETTGTRFTVYGLFTAGKS